MFLFKGLWEELIAIPLIDYPKHTVNWSPWWDMKKRTWVFDINIFGIFILSSSLGIITLLSWYYHTIIILGIVMILLWTKIQTLTKKSSPKTCLGNFFIHICSCCLFVQCLFVIKLQGEQTTIILHSTLPLTREDTIAQNLYCCTHNYFVNIRYTRLFITSSENQSNSGRNKIISIHFDY